MSLVGIRTHHLPCPILKRCLYINMLCPQPRSLYRIKLICKGLQPISYIHILHILYASFLKLSITISVLISRNIAISCVPYPADFSAVRLVPTFRFCFNTARNNCRQANRLDQQFSRLLTITDLTLASSNQVHAITMLRCGL
jgi:hypothetical protein